MCRLCRFQYKPVQFKSATHRGAKAWDCATECTRHCLPLNCRAITNLALKERSLLAQGIRERFKYCTVRTSVPHGCGASRSRPVRSTPLRPFTTELTPLVRSPLRSDHGEIPWRDHISYVSWSFMVGSSGRHEAGLHGVCDKWDSPPASAIFSITT